MVMIFAQCPETNPHNECFFHRFLGKWAWTRTSGDVLWLYWDLSHPLIHGIP